VGKRKAAAGGRPQSKNFGGGGWGAGKKKIFGKKNGRGSQGGIKLDKPPSNKKISKKAGEAGPTN